MKRFSRIGTASLSAVALGLVVAACQPQEASLHEESPLPAGAMTTSQVEALVVGSTVIGVDDKRNVTLAEYFSSDGRAKLKAKTQTFGTFNYDGTYFFSDSGQFCTNYPEIPFGPKEFCKYVISLGDGRYQQTDGIVYERILEGEQLDQLK